MPSTKVFVGMPTYDGTAHAAACQAVYITPTDTRKADGIEYFPCIHGGSLLSNNMNQLYVMALNGREKYNFKWFAMLHADMEPGNHWLDVLIDEAEEHGADMMTAVVPIKDERGVTSTGIAHPKHNLAPYLRLTQHQVNHSEFPDTFDLDACVDALARLPEGLCIPDAPRTRLLVNTGAMVVRLDRPWSEKLVFSTAEHIIKVRGKFVAKVESEDWRFGKLLADLGGKVMATRKLEIRHHGTGHFDSMLSWGNPIDKDCFAEHEYADEYVEQLTAHGS